jgi:Porin-like glycoporin RafY
MTRYSKLTAVAAAVLLATPAFAAMTTDANLELDSTYGNLSRGATQGGRVEFNVAGKAGDDNGFVAGRGTLLIKKDGTAATDDMWGQFGTGMASLKLGRFEAADMFPAGKDVLVEGGAEATGGYHAQTLRGRMGGDLFHGAVMINPGSGVGVEIGIVESKGAGNTKGIRPVVSFAAGPVSVKLGLESGQTNATPGVEAQKFSGFGVTVGGAFEGVGFNVNLASGKKKSYIDSTGATPVTVAETKGTSFGANATFGPAGVGLVSDSSKQAGVKSKDFVIYAAYSIPLFNTGATLTPAVSHQTGKVGGVSNKSATSVRARLNYTF